MKDIMEKLKRWGADPEDAIYRMMGDEQFYHSVLQKFAKGREWNELDAAVGQMRYSDAFRIAHDLKGVMSTLSLNPLRTIISDIVEELRNEPETEEQEKKVLQDMELFLQEIAVFEEIMNVGM